MTRSPGDFYVGYRPLPARHKLAAAVAAVLIVFGLGALAGVITSSQRDPGATVLLADGERDWAGVLYVQPFPMLVDDEGETYLLASLVKSGVADRVAGFDRQRVALRGFGQQRGSRRVIQMSDGQEAIAAEQTTSLSDPLPIVSGREIEVVGEILDSKCYTGAMKPGDGKAHKSCAILCLQGGIAAIVGSPDLTGRDELPLLRVAGSNALGPEMLELVGETVRIRGVLSYHGTLPVLDVQPGGITRLGNP